MKGTDWRRRAICYAQMFTIRDLLKRFIRKVYSFLIIVVSTICLQTVGWPKHSFGFFHKLLWANLNKDFGQPSVMLNKSYLSQKTTYCVIPFILNVQRRQIRREESRSVVARAGSREEWGVTANGLGVSFWGDENILKLDKSKGCTAL